MVNYDKNDQILSNIARIVEKRLPKNTDITLVLDKNLDKLESKIENGVISAGDYCQITDAAGRFLRNPEIMGTFRSNKEICGMYFASHNSNYYVSAPLEELFEYIEDLALWGMNVIRLWFDLYFYKNMEDGKEFADRLKKILKFSKSIGVKTFMVTLSNEAFHTSPKELRADWTGGHDGYIYPLNDHYHVEICPSKPGGMEKILEYRRQWLDVFGDCDIDYISFGPYDEGGCTCPDCAPWGANGYLRCCDKLIPLVKEYMPNTQVALSTWQFGTFTGTNVEFDALKKALEEERYPDCKFVQADPYYQSYAYEIDMGRPMSAGFEISMCETNPWGGYGTNPVPKRIKDRWDKYGHLNIGGCPYSEGYYEDINKVIMLRLYRDNQDPAVTIREYLAYEIGLTGEILEKVTEAVINMEETLYRDWMEGHRYLIHNPEKVFEIEKAVVEANESLPEDIRNSKRWQFIYLRGVIDGEIARNDFTRNDKVIEYFNKLIELGYLQNTNHFLKPDVVIDSDYGKEVLTMEEIKKVVCGVSPKIDKE